MLKITLTGQNTRVLAKAINSFSRIGNELYLEATQNGLILRTVNDAQTAFAVMKFELGFFTDFKIDRSNSDEFCNKCKVSMKCCLGVFKNMRQVEKCQITLNSKTSKILFQFNCLFDTIKTHNVSILEQESLSAVYMTDNPPNRITAPNKLFTEIISNFRMYDNEITIEAATDLVVLKNNIDMQTDKHLMRTKLTLKSQEFQEYRISEPTAITFCLKELRAILNFADALSLDMTINFETPGRPVVFAFGSQDMFTANFVMSTLALDNMSENDNPVMNMSKTTNDQENDTTATNLTLRLSDVIDLERDDNDARVPSKLTTTTKSKAIAETSAKRKGKVDRIAKPDVTVIPATLRTVAPSQNNPSALTTGKDIRNRSNVTTFPATLATTIVSQSTNAVNKENDFRDRSRSPHRQATNTAGIPEKQTDSEEIVVTFRDESQVENGQEIVDEVEIPASPQPDRRRRLKLFSRIYQNTQYAENLSGQLLAEMTDDEMIN